MTEHDGISEFRNHTAEHCQIFSACCLWPWLCMHLAELKYIMYFRLCGWRHVFLLQHDATVAVSLQCVYGLTPLVHSIGCILSQMTSGDKTRSELHARGMQQCVLLYLI